MSEVTAPTPSPAAPKKMDDIVALCRRRGFIFQSSEIYGGINGFWDYGPLGASLKRNLKNAWWNDVVERELIGPDGNPVDIVGVDCTIIMNPKTWVASGHQPGRLCRCESARATSTSLARRSRLSTSVAVRPSERATRRL